LFRMIGTSEFAEEHGWVKDWDPESTKFILEKRLHEGLRTFTGAYIITNQGIKKPKSEVVVDEFLIPIWKAKEDLAKVSQETQSLQATHEAMGKFRGWGGGGFMSYEVVTDLNYTSVLGTAKDRYTWANAGPGAKRGLNRLYKRDLKKSLSQTQANLEMQTLLYEAQDHLPFRFGPKDQVDMRTIEHSLCEFDKYIRVKNGEGKPRSRYNGKQDDLFQKPPKGAVL